MRGVAAVPIPGSHPEFPGPSSVPHGGHSRSGSGTHPSYTHANGFAYGQGPAATPGWDVMTPGGTRRSRLSGFWSGTADVDDPAYVYAHYVLPAEAPRRARDQDTHTQGGAGRMGDGYAPTRLPTIEGSPATSDPGIPAAASVPLVSASVPVSPTADFEDDQKSTPHAASSPARPASSSAQVLPRPRPPPATAPVRLAPEPEGDGDYFGVHDFSPKNFVMTRRSSGLRTPPATRAGSADSDEREKAPLRDEGGDERRTTELTENEVSNNQNQAPTTPDSNPARPMLGRAASGPAAGSAIYVDGEIQSDSPPNGTSNSSSDSTFATSTPHAPVGPQPSLDGANLQLDDFHRSLGRLDSLRTQSDTAYSGTSLDAAYPPGRDTAFSPDLMYGAHSVPAPAPRRGMLARQISAPLPAARATLAHEEPGRQRALSSDPGRDARTAAGEVAAATAAEAGECTAAGTGESGQRGAAGPAPANNDERSAGKQKAILDDARRSVKEDARAAREELAFTSRGFLAPPFPPDELGRRRALYK
ncbi:hypothetical protein B0H11DRAFT_1186443 [Mycena galericulata]|nr:hypothetical protein B0H11DRAFT_1186443 [Mycena galericulata]